MEVDAPLLSVSAGTDRHIDLITASVTKRGLEEVNYLISSPEFFMKRLLASGSPSIFYLGKVFRQGEHGDKHHHEFTMLEWYRLGWDEHQLIQEVEDLLQELFVLSSKKTTYKQLFIEVLGINPHRAELKELTIHVASRIDINTDILTRDDCLELLFSYCIEPGLQGINFVYEYPASQAALAQKKINDQGEEVARRFEVFIDDLEIGNGYFELLDPVEQKDRFQSDIKWRSQMGRPIYPVDEQFLQALQDGLPECAGVAIGVDRLLMRLLGASSIEEVFPLGL